jgi:hypothetical protein
MCYCVPPAGTCTNGQTQQTSCSSTAPTTTTTSTTTITVYAIAVQAGDLFDFVSFVVQAIATGTVVHSWAALYNGTATGAALLAQSTDVTTGYPVGLNKLQLGSVQGNVGTVGTAQGPSTAAVVNSGPAVWGVALYSPGTSAGAKIDGMLGGSLAGEIAVTGQVSLVGTGTITAGATAPSVLPTMTAQAAGVPYVVLSRQ